MFNFLCAYGVGGGRVVLAPVTRCRSYENLAQPHNALYYQQRAALGVLLIAEASAVSETATGYPRVPGLWSDEQVDAWKPVVDAVHAKGALFFCQLWHTGRNHSPATPAAGCFIFGSFSSPVVIVPFSFVPRLLTIHVVGFDGPPPRLETDEIPEMVMDFRVAARNAIRAGNDQTNN